ncbi:S41 family peptidase [Niabella aquatica]
MLKPLPVKTDSLSAKQQKAIAKKKKISKAERLKNARQLKINIDSGYAIMQLNSFSGQLQLKRFFRRSFSTLKKEQIKNLIIDLRLNGGGRVDNANYLLRRLTDKNYKAGDSLYATAAKLKYNPYIHNSFWVNLFIRANTNNKNGRRHFRYFERHLFKPKKHNHFNGQVYLLSGGRSYSASTMVLGILKGQPHVTIVGEPSGGAAYGNSAWQIPMATLPETAVRLRFPLFRYVMNKSLPHDGRGVQPDIYAGTNLEAIRMGRDYKMDKVKKLIKSKP